MKKLLLASLCMTAFTLTACDKKPNEATPTTTENTTVTTNAPATTATSAAPAGVLSNNVVADIRSDLDQLQTLSNTKAQEALKFQNEVTQAAQKGDKAALDQVVDQMDKYVDAFNDELEALNLKSAEGDALRDKMKDSNELGLELAEEGVKTPPNTDKINALQKKATDLQQSLLQDMQSLQSKVNGK
ncbi:hypothetical protein [Acinetobacter lanii]|uniref:Lipoprotein n=1 Tax=Acinetobacter lanii TaxID=2715163 RepID=A0A6G8S7J2_9GAMM|nr:hypothetical protein [Acinetobacter lanii]QIO10127.1 hypothetical protein G8D99_14690 [Acinetobacter lanii]